MLSAFIIFCFLSAISTVRTSHFRGGYLSWETVLPNATNATMVTINLQQTYSWTYTRYNCSSLVGDLDSLICISSNCSNYVSSMTTTQASCISYDVGLDISTGQSITPLTLLAGSQLILSYRSNAWLSLVQSTSLRYSLITFIDLRVRSDNGRINSSPTSTMIALVTVLTSSQQILRIPVADIDSDIIKCRWANDSSVIANTVVDECDGICYNIPGAQLYTSSNMDNNCSLIFTAAVSGYYVVALQIEDYMPSAPNGSALSSVPLQFLVHALSVSCNQSSIIGQLADGTTVQVTPNQNFSVSIIAQAGCNTTSVNRFLTIIAPSGTVNTTGVTSIGSLLYSMVFMWTPTISQIGSTQIYCTVAIDDNNLQSPQYCLNFIVAYTTTTTSSTTTSATLTASTTAASSTDKHFVDLVLLLSLGIPLLLSSCVLAICAACRWCPGQFWYIIEKFSIFMYNQ